jgi:hypothetical protein
MGNPSRKVRNRITRGTSTADDAATKTVDAGTPIVRTMFHVEHFVQVIMYVHTHTYIGYRM